MRAIDKIQINHKVYSFIELFYYDGPKLQVDVENNSVIVWHQGFDDHELWFKIDANKSNFFKYISNKCSLFDLIHFQETAVSLVNRSFEKYTELIEIKFYTSLEGIVLPAKDAYLGFDFYYEHFYNKYEGSWQSWQSMYTESVLSKYPVYVKSTNPSIKSYSLNTLKEASYKTDKISIDIGDYRASA